MSTHDTPEAKALRRAANSAAMAQMSVFDKYRSTDGKPPKITPRASRLLRTISDDALIAECRRRGLKVSARNKRQSDE